MRTLPILAALISIGVPATALGQEPDERDDAIFGGPEDKDKDKDKDPAIPDSRLAEEDDKLQLGGFLYLRANWSFTDSTEDLSDHPISMPSIVGLYLDGRPSDRLRGFVRGRLVWDPTVDEDEPSLLSSFSGSERSQVEVLLDELWLKFDLGRVVYLTLGQQHVRWGTTRVWNPVDMVNRSQRDPLALFDDRTGVPLIKLHFPLEAQGFNFIVLGMLDKVDTLDKAGVAGRLELVVGTVEMGLSGAWRDSIDPKLGFDISAGVWDLDLAAEVGLTFAEATPTVQVSGKVEYGVKYSDEDVLYLGLEYFYNQTGVSSLADALPSAAEIAAGAEVAFPQFFYIGKHYGALMLLLPGPGRWNDVNFTLSTIGNFSDLSFVTRLDVSVKVLTFMSLQMYVAGHYGEQGELRIGEETFGDFTPLLKAALYPDDPDRTFPTQLLDIGLNLRIDI